MSAPKVSTTDAAQPSRSRNGAYPAGNVYDKASTPHPVERRLVSGFTAALAGLLPRDPRRILEVGCGEGHQMRNVTAERPRAVVTGVDIAGATWLALRHPTRPRVAVGDAEELPFASRTFDLVLALEVLEHLHEPRAALAEIARVCDGFVIVSVPWEPMWRAGNMVRGRYVSSLGNTPGHLQHFTRRKCLRMIGDYLELDAVRRPFPWTIVRARTRRGR